MSNIIRSLIVTGIILGLLLILIITYVVLTSCGPHCDETDRLIHLNGSINSSDSSLELLVVSGSVTWTDYEIRIRDIDQNFTTLKQPDNITFSTAGEIVTYSSEDWVPIEGISYLVYVVDIGRDAVIWENNITAI